MRRPMAFFWTHCCLALSLCMSGSAWAAHAYAQFGDIRYPAGFTHFSYVNPAAPKGGETELSAAAKLKAFRDFIVAKARNWNF